MPLVIETELEDDGRWIAEIPQIPGALCYGDTKEHAIRLVKALVLRILADREEHGESTLSSLEFFKQAAYDKCKIRPIEIPGRHRCWRWSCRTA